jgi:hypothetical protein
MGIASFSILLFLGAPFAIVLGHRARKAIRDADSGLGGESYARWGLILGYLNLAVLAAILITALVSPLMR